MSNTLICYPESDQGAQRCRISGCVGAKASPGRISAPFTANPCMFTLVVELAHSDHRLGQRDERLDDGPVSQCVGLLLDPPDKLRHGLYQSLDVLGSTDKFRCHGIDNM